MEPRSPEHSVCVGLGSGPFPRGTCVPWYDVLDPSGLWHCRIVLILTVDQQCTVVSWLAASTSRQLVLSSRNCGVIGIGKFKALFFLSLMTLAMKSLWCSKKCGILSRPRVHGSIRCLDQGSMAPSYFGQWPPHTRSLSRLFCQILRMPTSTVSK